jgi:hypothetical protein
LPRLPLGAGPFVFDTAEQHKIRVTVVARASTQPWSLAFLPDGSMLVTELKTGQLRIVRGGVLDPKPVAGVRNRRPCGWSGLMDVVLHPRFEQQADLSTYSKPNDKGPDRWRSHGPLGHAALADVKCCSWRLPGTEGARLAHRVREGRDALHHVRRSRPCRRRTEYERSLRQGHPRE